MTTFVVLRHPVTILVADFTNPNNLTNDLIILFNDKISSKLRPGLFLDRVSP